MLYFSIENIRPKSNLCCAAGCRLTGSCSERSRNGLGSCSDRPRFGNDVSAFFVILRGRRSIWCVW